MKATVLQLFGLAGFIAAWSMAAGVEGAIGASSVVAVYVGLAMERR